MPVATKVSTLATAAVRHKLCKFKLREKEAENNECLPLLVSVHQKNT